jgi:PleD family two-component response regulator
MPVMDGFELCTHIRESGPNVGTPVVFITGLNDVASRSRGKQCGGNDFIKKPFLPIEMTLKALTFAWEGRLRQIEANAPSETAVAL